MKKRQFERQWDPIRINFLEKPMKYLDKIKYSVISALALAATFSSTPNQAAAGSNPFIGDIIAVGYNFCPRGWISAEGQLLPIASHTALFSLIGTTYGGDGRSTMGVPDLRGRVAMGLGRGPGLTDRRIGNRHGTESRVLTENQLPSHTHAVNANNLDGDKPGPGNKLLAAAPPGGSGSETIYSTGGVTNQMSSQMIATAGGSQPLFVQNPYLVMKYCVAVVGQYPSRP
jgi:microcystin-dependent protein